MCVALQSAAAGLGHWPTTHTEPRWDILSLNTAAKLRTSLGDRERWSQGAKSTKKNGFPDLPTLDRISEYAIQETIITSPSTNRLLCMQHWVIYSTMREIVFHCFDVLLTFVATTAYSTGLLFRSRGSTIF